MDLSLVLLEEKGLSLSGIST